MVGVDFLMAARGPVRALCEASLFFTFLFGVREEPFRLLFVCFCLFFLFFSPSPLLIRESSPRRTRGDHCAGHWRCVRRRATFALRRSSRTSRLLFLYVFFLSFLLSFFLHLLLLLLLPRGFLFFFLV